MKKKRLNQSRHLKQDERASAPTEAHSHLQNGSNNIISKNTFPVNSSLRDYVKWLLKIGFQPIPLRENSKTPACSWKKYQARRMTEEEIEKLEWHGIGIVLGSISGGLVVFDADTPLAKRLLECHPILRETAKVRTPTKDGFHYYLKIIDYPKVGVKKTPLYNGEIKIDLLAEGSLVVFPPTQLNGKTYIWERDLSQLKELPYEEFTKLKEEIIHALERLPKWNKTLELIKGEYKVGRRQFINLYLAGYLAKFGIPEFEALAHFSRLWEETEDEEREQRERAIKDTYKDYNDGKAITGWNGLQEILPSNLLEEIETIWGGKKESKKKEDTKGKVVENKKAGSGRFIVIDGEVQTLTRKGFVVLGPFVDVKLVLFDEEGDKRLIKASYGGHSFFFTLREAKERIEEYTAQAIRHRRDYLDWLSEEIKKAPEKRLIRTTGWSEDLREFYHPLREEEDKDWVFDDGHILKKERRAIIRNPEVQKELIRKALREGKFLGLLYVCSLAGILLYPLEIEPFVVIITGLSKSGKSLASTLAVQLFYRNTPPIANGLQTRNSWEFHLKRFVDLPFLFDELALMDKELVELIAFAVNSGYGKSRGNADKNVDRTMIRSLVILNAERFPYKAIKHAGAHRRVLHIKVSGREDLTSMEISGEEKKATGFGLELIDFTKEFLEKEKSKIEKLQDLPPIKRALVIALAIYERYYGESFLKTGQLIDEVLEEQERVFSEENDQVQKFLDRLREEIASNRAYYYSKGKKIEDMKEVRGRVENRDNEIIIDLLPRYFERLLRDEDGEEVLNKDIILKRLEEMGILRTDKGRKQNSISIGGYKTKAYTFILKPE